MSLLAAVDIPTPSTTAASEKASSVPFSGDNDCDSASHLTPRIASPVAIEAVTDAGRDDSQRDRTAAMLLPSVKVKHQVDLGSVLNDIASSPNVTLAPLTKAAASSVRTPEPNTVTSSMSDSFSRDASLSDISRSSSYLSSMSASTTPSTVSLSASSSTTAASVISTPSSASAHVDGPCKAPVGARSDHNVVQRASAMLQQRIFSPGHDAAAVHAAAMGGQEKEACSPNASLFSQLADAVDTAAAQAVMRLSLSRPLSPRSLPLDELPAITALAEDTSVLASLSLCKSDEDGGRTIKPPSRPRLMPHPRADTTSSDDSDSVVENRDKYPVRCAGTPPYRHMISPAVTRSNFRHELLSPARILSKSARSSVGSSTTAAAPESTPASLPQNRLRPKLLSPQRSVLDRHRQSPSTTSSHVHGLDGAESSASSAMMTESTHFELDVDSAFGPRKHYITPDRERRRLRKQLPVKPIANAVSRSWAPSRSHSRSGTNASARESNISDDSSSNSSVVFQRDTSMSSRPSSSASFAYQQRLNPWPATMSRSSTFPLPYISTTPGDTISSTRHSFEDSASFASAQSNYLSLAALPHDQSRRPSTVSTVYASATEGRDVAVDTVAHAAQSVSGLSPRTITHSPSNYSSNQTTWSCAATTHVSHSHSHSYRARPGDLSAVLQAPVSAPVAASQLSNWTILVRPFSGTAAGQPDDSALSSMMLPLCPSAEEQRNCLADELGLTKEVAQKTRFLLKHEALSSSAVGVIVTAPSWPVLFSPFATLTPGSAAAMPPHASPLHELARRTGLPIAAVLEYILPPTPPAEQQEHALLISHIPMLPSKPTSMLQRPDCSTTSAPAVQVAPDAVQCANSSVAARVAAQTIDDAQRLLKNADIFRWVEDASHANSPVGHDTSTDTCGDEHDSTYSIRHGFGLASQQEHAWHDSEERRRKYDDTTSPRSVSDSEGDDGDDDGYHHRLQTGASAAHLSGLGIHEAGDSKSSCCDIEDAQILHGQKRLVARKPVPSLTIDVQATRHVGLPALLAENVSPFPNKAPLPSRPASTLVVRPSILDSDRHLMRRRAVSALPPLRPSVDVGTLLSGHQTDGAGLLGTSNEHKWNEAWETALEHVYDELIAQFRTLGHVPTKAVPPDNEPDALGMPGLFYDNWADEQDVEIDGSLGVPVSTLNSRRPSALKGLVLPSSPGAYSRCRKTGEELSSSSTILLRSPPLERSCSLATLVSPKAYHHAGLDQQRQCSGESGEVQSSPADFSPPMRRCSSDLLGQTPWSFADALPGASHLDLRTYLEGRLKSVQKADHSSCSNEVGGTGLGITTLHSLMISKLQRPRTATWSFPSNTEPRRGSAKLTLFPPTSTASILHSLPSFRYPTNLRTAVASPPL
ncbi:hypothetical protein K437DRAFT_258515 [Tilletiaria anomala UBC 951]|uniref:Uncharacterized protein n=1 Tax=Tilletiaria anomala (strain ATCC 24038 / CBS 436.72 / UBC 951) TaxID=1037660 RepID=A0A066VPT0_TILAU|nr:uncharacterized protein K437DRAFT_258515 [Tilletiaria anomala UBC 951]KDN40774.1 hypothetical protein K437DRAFT_258515 [Tilletiaria anomala UBC 951]